MGRKPVTVVASVLSPFCLTFLIVGTEWGGLIYIYGVMTVMALAYNPRSSTAYLYAAELLPPNRRLFFGTSLFLFDGMFSVFAAFYFWKFGDMNALFIGVGVVFCIALTYMTIVMPETPSFLLAKGDVEGYQASLSFITGTPYE